MMMCNSYVDAVFWAISVLADEETTRVIEINYNKERKKWTVFSDSFGDDDEEFKIIEEEGVYG